MIRVTVTPRQKEGLYRKFREAHFFYGVVILATICGLLLTLSGLDPMKALIAAAVNIAFKFLLMGPLAQVGLALATSIGAWINLGLVIWFAHRAGHVFSVEIKPALAAFGRRNLERHGVGNLTLEEGDAARGWAAHAPYDVIVLTGSTPVLPKAFLEQLAQGGRLFAVVGDAPIMKARLITCVAPGTYRGVDAFETVLAPLVNAEQPPRFRF